ncbi:glycosyltransferase [Dictyobacter formicarum]|nr:glycosyltransferase [Dictyobacter formicarum]
MGAERNMQHREAFQYDPHGISTVTLSTSEAISIVIPTLNEAENIGHLLTRLHQALTEAAISYEVIVVDDHSNDDTVAVARAIAKEKNLPVQILTKKGLPGKSYSLIEGFAAARFAMLAMIDGDLQYPPEALPLMVQASRHADIVIADRRATYHEADRMRGRLSQIFTYLITMLFAIDTDIQSGLKVFRRAIYDNGARSCSGKWNLDLYLVTHAVLHGHTLANVPIEFQERQAGESKVHPLKVGLELLWTALQLKMDRIASVILKESVFRPERYKRPTKKNLKGVR